jgi:BlaI family transcriptional regulator, penicillinase repressor
MGPSRVQVTGPDWTDSVCFDIAAKYRPDTKIDDRAIMLPTHARRSLQSYKKPLHKDQSVWISGRESSKCYATSEINQTGTSDHGSTLVPRTVFDPRDSRVFPPKKRLAYTTVQTMVYRLEVKNAVRRIKKITTAFVFDAAVSREAAPRRLVDELLSLFGGRSRPITAHLADSGALTLEEVREAEKDLMIRAKEDQPR